MSDFQTEAAAVAKLSADPLQYLPDGAGGVRDDAVLLRSDYSVKDIEHLLPNRRQFRGEFQTRDVGAFFKYVSDAYVETEGSPEDFVQVFVSEESMSATAYIDYLSSGLPGHCAHMASIRLPKTQLYKEVLVINGDKMSARFAAEWIEDNAHRLSFTTAEGEAIKTSEVLAAVRNMDITRARNIGHEVAQLSDSMTAMEKVEAKAKIGQVPAYAVFSDPCFEQLAPVTFKMRFGVLTGGDQPAYKLDLINQGELEHERAAAFVQLLESEGCEQAVVRLGTFSP